MLYIVYLCQRCTGPTIVRLTNESNLGTFSQNRVHLYIRDSTPGLSLSLPYPDPLPYPTL